RRQQCGRFWWRTAPGRAEHAGTIPVAAPGGAVSAILPGHPAEPVRGQAPRPAAATARGRSGRGAGAAGTDAAGRGDGAPVLRALRCADAPFAPAGGPGLRTSAGAG